MNVLKIIQTLTLATLLVLALSACSNKDNNDTNATEQTTGTSQAGGEDGIANTASTGGTTNSTGTTTSSGAGTQSTGGGSTDANSNDSNDGTATGSDSGNTDSSTSTENNSNNTSDDNTVEDNTTNQDNNASADNNTTQNTDDNTSTENNNTNNTENNTTNQDNNASVDNNTTQNTDNNTSTETNSTVDVTPPVLTLNGKASITLQQNAVYTELGATALDAVDGNVFVSINGNVDTATVGGYTVTYTAQDSAGNEANATRTIMIVDVTPPVVTLNGQSNITLEQNAVYTELGATAQDAVDGNVSVAISGTVDTSMIGSYTVMYTAQDSAGNEANVTRSITVIDVTPPVLTLNGEVDMSLFVGDAYVELGATAVDAVDGNVSVSISAEVDTDTEGTYIIMYTAQDNSGNEANVTRTIRVLTPTVTSLSLSSSNTALNVGETTDLSLQATYSNNTSKTLTNNIEWIVSPSDAVQIADHTLTAKKDTNITLQAKVGNTLSNTIALNITWVVNGHVLPPEPDKALNDSTLLGIDVNDNGVRDDVERWIYEEYKDKHPVHIDIAMQAARGYKLVLEHPERAKEIYFYATAYLDCKSYYSTYAKYFNEPILIQDDSGVGEYFRNKIYFNTLERKASYNQYDNVLSGDSYSLPKIEDLKSLCDFNTSKYTE